MLIGAIQQKENLIISKKEGRYIKGILIKQEQVKSDVTWENKLLRPSRAVRAEYGHTDADRWVGGDDGSYLWTFNADDFY